MTLTHLVSYLESLGPDVDQENVKFTGVPVPWEC